VQAGLHQDAAKLAVGLESQEQSLSLQIAIKYEQNDIAGQSGLPGCCLTSPKPYIAVIISKFAGWHCKPSGHNYTGCLQAAKGCWRSCLLTALMANLVVPACCTRRATTKALESCLPQQ